jgi:hypothetical protein
MGICIHGGKGQYELGLNTSVLEKEYTETQYYLAEKLQDSLYEFIMNSLMTPSHNYEAFFQSCTTCTSQILHHGAWLNYLLL